MNPQRRGPRRALRASAVMAAALAVTMPGCSRESLRVALDAQRRADQVQQAVFDDQHAALSLLLYRDTLRRLEAGGTTLTPVQKTALNAIWNERDLVEFWALQHERATALRLMGVDSKLFAEQSTVDLLAKALERTGRRVDESAAAVMGRKAAEAFSPADADARSKDAGAP